MTPAMPVKNANHEITFENVKGYATRANAKKRGDEVAAMIQPHVLKGGMLRYVLLQNEVTGRWVPAFIVNGNVPGGPGMFIGLTNVCVFN